MSWWLVLAAIPFLFFALMSVSACMLSSRRNQALEASYAGALVDESKVSAEIAHGLGDKRSDRAIAQPA